ncbi:MAG: hypothetical protein LR015_05255 [Verrucomicrobia bacterium]|nr:hypothetical protein [Verrucomicrobiota bacterium]
MPIIEHLTILVKRPTTAILMTTLSNSAQKILLFLAAVLLGWEYAIQPMIANFSDLNLPVKLAIWLVGLALVSPVILFLLQLKDTIRSYFAAPKHSDPQKEQPPSDWLNRRFFARRIAGYLVRDKPPLKRIAILGLGVRVKLKR